MTDDEAKAEAFVALMLVNGLMRRLVDKGYLDQEDRVQLLEGLLTTLEEGQDATDPVNAEARKIVDVWAQIAATGSWRVPKPSPS